MPESEDESGLAYSSSVRVLSLRNSEPKSVTVDPTAEANDPTASFSCSLMAGSFSAVVTDSAT